MIKAVFVHCFKANILENIIHLKNFINQKCSRLKIIILLNKNHILNLAIDIKDTLIGNVKDKALFATFVLLLYLKLLFCYFETTLFNK